MPTGIYIRTEEHSHRISEGLKKIGHKPPITRYWLGKHRSADTIKKMSKANIGKVLSDECRKKISLALKGKPQPWQKGRKQSKEEIEKRVNPCRKEKHWNWKGGCSTDKEYIAKQNKIWALNNRELCRFYARKRSAMRKGAVGSHTLKEWNDLKELYGFMCLCCKQTEPEIKLTEDHIIPLSRGGTNYIDNIQPLCQPCNMRKFVKTIDYRNPIAEKHRLEKE